MRSASWLSDSREWFNRSRCVDWGNHAEALELAQEVLLRAMDRLHQLSEPAAFGGWIRSITVRMAINRQVRRRRTVDAEPQTLEATCIDEGTPFDSAVSA